MHILIFQILVFWIIFLFLIWTETSEYPQMISYIETVLKEIIEHKALPQVMYIFLSDLYFFIVCK